MLNNVPYYRQSINRYATAFMSLFAEIYIQKQDSTGQTVNTVKVPIAYGPRQKWLGLLTGNPDLNRPVGITVPRIGVEMIGMNYAPDRKLNSTNQFVANYSNASNIPNQNVGAGDPSSASFVYVPVPMDITWRLDIMTNNQDDASQILEQIIPVFTPEWVNRVRIVDELDIEFNIPIVFKSAGLSDSYGNGDNTERRILVWSLGFDMKAYFVGQPQTSKIIKISTVTASVTGSNNETYSYTSTPGMTANGQPTTNAAASISPLLINQTDNWGYAASVIDNTDS